MFLEQLLMEEEPQSSPQCAEHKGDGNSVYHQQSLQKSTAMKWQQFPCFGKLRVNQVRQIILQDHPGSGAQGWGCLQSPRASPAGPGQAALSLLSLPASEL